MINYLQLRSIYIYTNLEELTTIHVTYIKKGKTVHYIYIIFNSFWLWYVEFASLKTKYGGISLGAVPIPHRTVFT